MTTQFLPAACRCGASGYIVPATPGGADAPRPIKGLIPASDALPITTPPPRDRTVATHEAAHAIVGHVLGLKIERVSIEFQPCVAWSDMPAGGGHNRAMVALAGDHGARLVISRHEFRPHDADVITTFNTVRNLRVGGCDACVAALACFSIAGSRAGDAALLAAYRRAEAATIALLRNPNVASAVRVLAGLLMTNGEMPGPSIHNCLTTIGLPFSSAADQFTSSQETSHARHP